MFISTMQPKFLYFDLGKVLVDFDNEVMCRQIGDVAGIDPARVRQVVVSGGLQLEYETGRISSREFYEAFCRQTLTRPDYQSLLRAGCDIFTLKESMTPVVAGLRAAGCRLGILSNTCEGHWEHCLRRFAMLREHFSVYALSFQIGVCKPDPAIFRRAAELAGCRPGEIFYTDDVAGHVEGARSVGFDAVVFISADQVAAELRHRGIGFD